MMMFGVDGMAIPTVADLLRTYSANLAWNLFLTSTGVHAVLLITSPVQAVYKWYRRQSSDSDTPLPYFCGFIGSALWLRYSIFIRDVKLILLQSYAVTLQLSFLFIMLRYRTKKRRLFRLIVGMLVGVWTFFYGVTQLSHANGTRFTGICASGAQIGGSLVCLFLIHKAIRLRRIDFIPFAPAAFTWVMELHAIIYSIGIDDLYLLTANTVFFCMDGCLLAMFFVFPSTSVEEDAARLLLKRTKSNLSVDAGARSQLINKTTRDDEKFCVAAYGDAFRVVATIGGSGHHMGTALLNVTPSGAAVKHHR